MLKTIVIFIIALLGFGMIRLPLQNRRKRRGCWIIR